jgi:hypothetical protein
MGSNHFVNPAGYTYERKPQLLWRAERIANVRRVIAILRTTRMPHPKLNLLDIMEQFLDIPRTIGKHTDEATLTRMRTLWEASKTAHLYQGITA